MNLKSIAFDKGGRVRSGWRVTVYIASSFFASLTLLMAALPLVTALGVEIDARSSAIYVVQFGISATVCLMFGWLWGRVFEALPFRALGAAFTAGWFRDMAAGLVIGAASLLIAAGVVAVSGGLALAPNPSDSGAIARTLLGTLAIFSAGAAFEEIFYRGYVMQTLFRARYAAFAIVFTSLFFATSHNANPGASAFSWINTFLAGIWLAVAYVKTRNLWFPFGIHLAWNWTQGPLLGIPVSGLESLAPEPLLRATVSGPDWLSGGAYGLEGGAACTVALVVSTIAIRYLPGLAPTEELRGFLQPT
jgi:hypothetical protein